jgi:hypothetical protein
MTQQAPYSYLTLAQLQQAVANRLYDQNMVFWTAAELTTYIQEALRTWNAMAGYWREDFLFPTVQGTQWYDIPSVANTLRPYTVTDANLYAAMQYHLLEPQGMNPWIGSLQFTADDLVQAVARRRDRLLSESDCTQSRVLVPAVAGRITLADNVIDIRRVAYFPTIVVVTGAGYGIGRYGFGLYGESAIPGIDEPQPVALFDEDVWAEQAFNYQFPQLPAGSPGTPSVYIAMSTPPPLSFDVDTPPAYAGSYEVLTVNAGGTLSPATPSLFTIPDDWTHVIKWGALADLFGRDANARDPLRAEYCEKRYRLGVQAMKTAPALLAARINNQVLQVDAVSEADRWDVYWQAVAQGAPTSLYYSGLNLLGLSAIPDAGVATPSGGTTPYQITATVVENAPIPVNPADLVQLSREDLDAVIDYVQHIATLKEGGAEFTATLPLFKRFLEQASLYNRKLREFAEFTEPIYALAQHDLAVKPVQTEETPETTSAQ